MTQLQSDIYFECFLSTYHPDSSFVSAHRNMPDAPGFTDISQTLTHPNQIESYK